MTVFKPLSFVLFQVGNRILRPEFLRLPPWPPSPPIASAILFSSGQSSARTCAVHEIYPQFFRVPGAGFVFWSTKCTKTAHNNPTSYVRIRTHVSFKTAFNIKSEKHTRVQCSVRCESKVVQVFREYTADNLWI